eukprot:714006-Prorocentrum_minimum.AAC.1
MRKKLRLAILQFAYVNTPEPEENRSLLSQITALADPDNDENTAPTRREDVVDDGRGHCVCAD